MPEFFNMAFGVADTTLTWWQMSLRAVVVFLAALAIIRIGNPRIFGKSTAFDIVLGIMYGSLLSRAITGNSPLFPTIVASLVLVLLHRALASVAYSMRWGSVSDFLKGRTITLIKDGKLQQEALRENSITENDLKEALRKQGCTDLEDVHTACLERNGDISVVKKKE
ncbi:DUF421 domain-containing protein [Pontibacter ruber]|nr:YetF domain-containing protein [Pontibacter ruber]